MVPRVPTITLVVAAYFVGLILGFHGWVAAVVGAALSLAGAAAFGLVRHAAALAVFLVAGAVLAVATVEDEKRCAASLVSRLANGTVAGTLLTDARPGGFARARTAGCDLTVALLVEDGTAGAGSVVRIAGDVARGDRGLTIRDATIARLAGPPVLGRLRARAGQSIDRTFRGDAPLVRALLIADTHGLTPELRDRFAVSGLAHILSISGLHVAIIAIAVELVLGLLRIPSRRAQLLSLGIIVFYVAMLGAPPPAVRSAVMLAARSVSKLAQRPTSPWAMLTLGALQPVFTPRTVLDLGYQLSVVGVAALIAGGVLVRRLAVPARPKWRREIIAGAVCSVIATVASAPLVIWYFGRVSVIGPVSNLVAGPIVALLQPMLFFALVLSPFQSAATFVADAAHPLLAALDGAARLTASVPGAAISAWATPFTATLLAIACASVLVACVHDRPLRPACLCALAFALIAWAPLVPGGSGEAEVHMLDVGQGDALAVRTPRGRWVVIDAGRAWSGGDAGRTTVVPYLARQGGEVDAFVLSHAHSDHVGGASTVIRALRPARYFDAAFVAPNASYRASLAAARDQRVRWGRVHPGDSLVVDGVAITFLAPDSAWTASLADPNNASVVAMVRMGGVRVLFTGDAESDEEAWLVERYGDALRADVLKVGHHGSKTSSTEAFLDVVRPRVALVSVGAGNTYGHPSPSVIEDFARRRVPMLRTDQLGTIIVRTDGRRITIDAGGTKWDVR